MTGRTGAGGRSRPRPTRRALLGGGGALALAGATGAGFGLAARRGEAAPPDPERPLRIAYLPITDAAPLLIAHARGHFARAGIEVAEPIRLRSWSTMGEALLAGSVDLVHLLFPMALRMRLDLGADIRVLGANHVDGSALTLGRDVPEVAALAGRTLAVPGWYSIHNVIVQQMLRAEGLTPVVRRTASRDRGEVTLVPMAPADMIPALDAGSIGGYTVADPFNAMGESTGVGTIGRFLGDVWRSHPCCVTVATSGLLRRPAEQLQAVADALVLAQIDCREDREGVAADLAGTYLPQPLPAIRAAMHRDGAGHAHVAHPDWRGEEIGFTPVLRPGFTAQLVRELGTTLLDAPLGALGELDPAAVHDLVVDDTALRDAARRLDPDSLTALEDPEVIDP
ncbi:ABC transporter substrate-binding protein [Brachybacterium aquaticum]|uniref:NitT/TauT family transport system substrate-binding protein n=1 Tax=Brachybacterium aquaticum TaxID=1432564 RepID=A0A841AIL2_9MICO|nr:ABC transporter substrate-binding protein [Brachybacterium aquaticum]MBB5833155.1 NitT/TauT family transport system substrate-binding protein [Brachybacterium aquaticum]